LNKKKLIYYVCEVFVNTNLTEADKKKLGAEFERRQQSRQQGRTHKRKGGFQLGNQAARKKNSVSKFT
jgi:hypothetical protein